MKNRKLTYILIPLVCGIWGWLIYNFFGMITDSEKIIAINPGEISKDSIVFTTKKINSKLEIVKRDPFLNIYYKKDQTKRKVPRLAKVSQPEIIQWPSIQYLGKVEGSESGNNIFLVEIFGQQKLMEIGENYHDVLLIKGNEKKIVLKFEGSYKTFSK